MEDSWSSWLPIIIPPLLMAFGGIVSWIIKSRTEELKATEERLRQERVKVYTEILSPYIQILSDPSGPMTARAGTKIASLDYKRIGFELALLGDDEVVRAWSNLLQYFYTHGESQRDFREALRLLGRMLLEIRRSLGNKRTKLTEFDMLRWLIKDTKSIEHSISS